MRFKKGVDLNGVRLEILEALPVIEKVWQHYGREAWITSGRDGKHKEGSRHYVGFAVDVRNRWWTGEVKQQASDLLRSMLPDAYDVVLERTHVHVEYDPK